MKKNVLKKAVSAVLTAAMLAGSASAFAAADDYWRFKVGYGDSHWKGIAETGDNDYKIDYTNIAGSLNNAKTYFDVTTETADSYTGNDTVVFRSKLDDSATAQTTSNKTVTINDSTVKVDGDKISYYFDFKPLAKINTQNYMSLKIRMSGGAFYNRALIVKGQTAGQGNVVGIGLGNIDGTTIGDFSQGSNADWFGINKWYRYFIEADRSAGTVHVGVKRLEDDVIIKELKNENVSASSIPENPTIEIATINGDGVSYEFKTKDGVTYTQNAYTVSEENSTDLYTTEYKSSNTYLKLTPKKNEDVDYASSCTEGLGYYFTMYSGGHDPSCTSGVLDYSMIFKAKVTATDNSLANKIVLTSRMANDVTWDYALRVGGINNTTNSINIGIGGIDANVDAGGNNKNNEWTSANAWYKYYIHLDVLKGTVKVGVTNLSTGDEVFAPYEGTFDTTRYTSLNTQVTTSVKRYGAEFAFDDVYEERDIYIAKDGEIAVDDTADTVTAKVQMANDVSTSQYNPTPWTQAGHEPTLILATFRADNSLIGIKSVKPTLSRDKGNGDAAVWHDVTVTLDKTADYDHAKAFLWKDWSSLIPFSKPILSTVAAVTE